MTAQLELEQSIRRHNEPHPAIAQVARNAGEQFQKAAPKAVLEYLKTHGDSSGEAITDAVKAQDIVPHDDRAFGSVYHHLARQGKIEKRGYATRTKGHGTSGGNIWGLKE